MSAPPAVNLENALETDNATNSQENPDTGTESKAERFVMLKTTPTMLYRAELKYACEFPVKPESLYYYYNPVLNLEIDDKRRAILEGSPEFVGPWNTKWQVSMTINRWIGTERWFSLYLTRLDNDNTPLANQDIKLMCQFRIVDRDRQPLKTLQSSYNVSKIGETRGFTRFLPFRDLPGMLTEDYWLLIEADLQFMSNAPPPTDLTTNVKVVTFAPTGSPVPVDAHNEPPKPVSPLFVEIKHDDKVAIYLDSNRIAHASRKKLLEHSKAYNDILKNNVKNSWIEIKILSTGGFPERKVIYQCVQYLHEDNCEYLVSGGYTDIYNLFEFAKDHLAMEKLMIECLNKMCTSVNCANATSMAMIIRGHSNIMSIDKLNQFRKFFRENILTIRKTDYFKAIIEAGDNLVYFFQLTLSPDFNFEEAQGSDDSDSGDSNSEEEVFDHYS